MDAQKGSINVTSENIFPVIKKFLYSDHEIFLRELVSNAVDATQKLKTLNSVGEYKGPMNDLNVEVKIDKEAGTLSVIDHGVGMTSGEIDKYINQIAFSGAEEFLAKYKNDSNAIIGHFGLGFYSAFMVATKVVIKTKSYRDDSVGVEWECDGSPEFTMKDIDKKDRGTEIILYIDDENKDFLEKSKVESLLKKYCRYLPVPIIFGKKEEWKDGKMVETDQDNIINKTEPEWTKSPATLTDKDYINFYHDLYPMSEDPLFWIHLNVDFPFHLTGILYFPKLDKNNFNRNKIQLYCNQVFVTDSVEGVVPEFMMLLQGVIDSPDIPLNVSRSYLQSDSNVKKISGYITRKVADRLQQLFNDDRKEFETKWDDIKIFIEFGMLSDEKFFDRAKSFTLLKNIDGQYFSLEEYQNLIKDNQTDKDGQLIYLYANDKDTQYQYIENAKAKGYDVLLMDGQLDNHLASMLEQKLEKSRFVRVDSDIIPNLIKKDDIKTDSLNDDERRVYAEMFKSQIPTIENSEFIVMFEAVGALDQPLLITQNEFMRRMKEMQSVQPGMSFYGKMPDSFNLIVNIDNPLVKKVLEKANISFGEEIAPINVDIKEKNLKAEELRKATHDKKEDEIPVQDKESLRKLEDEVADLRKKEEDIVKKYASSDSMLKQLVDLAFLSNNMLKGEALSNFIKRSTQLL
ncbi:MAG: molecular chaperone HtpG [Bacteroidales bacterium]|nr:molecular chaperone HtpG [Bacteroidales bacterium]